MKQQLKRYSFAALLLMGCHTAVCAQEQAAAKPPVTKPQSKGHQKGAAYAGIGCGLDYGGIGLKFEAVPIPYLGIFGGIGHAGLGLGMNGGLSVKPLPKAEVQPVLLAMYGYNDILSYGKHSMRRDISHGFTIGAGMEWKAGKNGNKLSMSFLAPLPQGEHHSPVTISLGFMLRVG